MDAVLQRLQGTWQAVKIETAGGPVPAEAARRLSDDFEGDRVTLLEGQEVTGAGTFSVDSRATPKAIDVVISSGPGRGRSALGIYEVTADRLTLCIGEERPAGFSGAGPAVLVIPTPSKWHWWWAPGASRRGISVPYFSSGCASSPS